MVAHNPVHPPRAMAPTPPSAPNRRVPPTTRAAARASAAYILDLLALPDELLLLAARQLLKADLPSALRLCETSAAVRAKLPEIKAEAEARRLKWLPEMTVKHSISNEGRTCSHSRAGCCPRDRAGGRAAWAARRRLTLRFVFTGVGSRRS